jgi:hypothetical protein
MKLVRLDGRVLALTVNNFNVLVVGLLDLKLSSLKNIKLSGISKMSTPLTHGWYLKAIRVIAIIRINPFIKQVPIMFYGDKFKMIGNYSEDRILKAGNDNAEGILD